MHVKVKESTDSLAQAPSAIHIDAINEFIQEDRRISVRQIAHQLAISKSTVHRIVKKILKYRKAGALWVPHRLSDANRQQRIHVCEDLLERYEREGDEFMQRIVTVDETYVYFYDPLSKREARVWKHRDSPRVMECAERSKHKIMMVSFLIKMDLF